VKTYQKPITTDAGAVSDEIQRAAFRAEPYFLPQQLFAEPERKVNGMTVWADGSTWNPGSGAGMYQLRAGVWNFLG